ncbi:four helix bundle protein [Candidatus Peregrinibacteria bacterium CG10_big_fil_rev_8_21_14_0_10_55_24]|nr:MAG: four helix bundle protein [Candidatus Peregrinibacteria bacterium CG10_big_fil_rev_8_21_14_0_10_55_24]
MQNAECTAQAPHKKIRSFTDLNTWKNGHKLVVDVYGITQTFPREELFGLTNQLRRAAVSFTSNIVEGFRRKSQKEKLQFYSIARGSLGEIQNQLLIARDIGYLPSETFQKLARQTVIVDKLTSGLLKKSKTI